MKYKATVRTSKGNLENWTVKSSNRQSAAKELGVSPSRVLAVKVDWWSTLTETSVGSKGPDKSEQAIFLMNLSAQFNGKRAIREIFESYLERDKRFKIDPVKAENAIEVEHFLDALGFEHNVVVLARAGREGGDLPRALQEAAQYLEEEESRRGAVIKKLSSGIFYSSAAVAMAIFGSMGFSAQLQDMEKNIGIPFEYNLASETLFALDFFFSTYGVYLLALMLLAIPFRANLMRACGNWPVVSQINRIKRVQRGINFLSIFAILRRAKKTDVQSIEYIASHSSGEDAEIYNRLAAVKHRGQRLHTGLREADWSPTILAGLGQLEDMDNESSLKTMRAILNGQRQELTKAAEGLATKLQMFGMLSLVITIIVTIVGFLLPILSVTTTPFG